MMVKHLAVRKNKQDDNDFFKYEVTEGGRRVDACQTKRDALRMKREFQQVKQSRKKR